jgi:D-amino-acid dehydrogenase
MMKAIVLGAGIVGVTTAYQLAKAGYQVTLVDKSSSVALGASYANGGQLSYRYKTPLAHPKMFTQLPKILCGLDPAFTIRPSANIQFYHWGMRYLWQCLPHHSKRSSRMMQDIGQLAEQEMASIINNTQLRFDYRQSAGKLYLYRNAKAFNHSASMAGDGSIWSREKIAAEMPALAQGRDVVGGIFDACEDSGDCYQFSQQLLAHICEKYDVTTVFNCEVFSFEVNKQSIRAIKTDQGLLKADTFILAAGVHSPSLCRPLGVRLPIYPMKGYSITVPATSDSLSVSITDTDSRMVFCRLGDRLRIAGMAEFSDFDTVIHQKSVDQLLNKAKLLLPTAGDYHQLLNVWCGLRPVTPDSLPIVSRSRYQNLILNTGHGMLGWTYAAATAKMVIDMLLEKAGN